MTNNNRCCIITDRANYTSNSSIRSREYFSLVSSAECTACRYFRDANRSGTKPVLDCNFQELLSILKSKKVDADNRNDG